MTLDEAIKKLQRQKAEYLDEWVDFSGIAEAFDMAIQALGQTDGDLISRDYVLSKFKEQCDICGKYKENNGVMCNCCALDDAIDYVEDAPSAEKTAEWIKQKSGDELFPEEIVCSKCYHSNSHLDFDEHNNPIGKVFLKSKYCPNCGARMKEGDTE